MINCKYLNESICLNSNCDAYACNLSDEYCEKCNLREILPQNVINHRDICNRLNEIYAKKNEDYGDSFSKTFLEEGMAMPRIRLSDKLERFKRLSKAERKVKDENIIDTLLDLANYAIMTVIELEKE